MSAPNDGEVSEASTVISTLTGDVPTLVYTPLDPAYELPAVVLSTEAFGINKFTRSTAARLARRGYVVVVPDYYRGEGPTDSESYTDFTEVLSHIAEFDFVQGTHDILDTVEYARSLAQVCESKVCVWGYCTGGTLAMLAAALDRDLAAAVLFFPSQPTFLVLTAKRPLHPIDLLWNIRCPVLLIAGELDSTTTPHIPEIQRRLRQWHVEHVVRIYPGAGHAFSAPVPPLRHEASDNASWAEACAFVARYLGQ